MALTITNAGELLLLEWALRSTSTPEDLVLKLYSNNYTPVATSTASNFTEANFTGYSAKSITRASWGTPTTNANGEAEVSATAQDWSAESDQTIYGYFLVGAVSGTVVWAQRFSVPRSVTSGTVLRVPVRFTLRSA